MNRDRLLQRFLRYIQIDTTAQGEADGYPSSPGQMELGRLLLGELKAMGLADASQNQHGIVMATVPGRCGKGDSPHVRSTLRAVPAKGTVPFSAPWLPSVPILIPRRRQAGPTFVRRSSKTTPAATLSCPAIPAE